MLRFIGPIFDNALSALTREPLPNLRHVFQLLFQLGVFHLSSCVTTVGGVLLVYGYTLLFGTSSLASNGAPYRSLDYSPITEDSSWFTLLPRSFMRLGLLFAKRFGKLSVPRHQWGFGSESAGSFKCFARSAASFR
jgi:hypothetical protein